MNALPYIKDQFEQLPGLQKDSVLNTLRNDAFKAYDTLGIPTTRNEEWKYTRVSGLFNKEYQLPATQTATSVTAADIDAVRLPGHAAANELVFVNGVYNAALSTIRSASLVLLPLQEAAQNEYATIVAQNLGHSSKYLKDGIHALNTAFVQDGIFLFVGQGKILEHPVYVYHITDARNASILAQPRSLVFLSERAQAQLTETFTTLGAQQSFTSQVLEIVVEKDAIAEHYKIQNDAPHTNLVSTTHIRQTGKSVVHTVTISLNGGIVRNNLNIAMEAANSEAHLYGLYFQEGTSHVDNHTVVDNAMPGCQSNELYKGILDGHASGVFNGKIFVQRDAQKINAYQSNKNILLSETASVNTKPQLEIFADDVKCSHGCTVGQLDEEGMFYLRSRGIPKKAATALLLHGFVVDILEKIKSEAVRTYVDELISKRLEFDVA
jgi:Fe-S cluster assembly protein SufD